MAVHNLFWSKMPKDIPEFDDMHWANELEYWSTPSESAQKTQNEESSNAKSAAFVSDSNARDPRQLLHVHIYNYLIKNGHYATARQFLKEADIPLENPRQVPSGNANKDNNPEKHRLPPGLLKTKLQLDSEETLLLRWWNCLYRLWEHVERTPSQDLRRNPSNTPTPLLSRGRKPSSEIQRGDSPKE